MVEQVGSQGWIRRGQFWFDKLQSGVVWNGEGGRSGRLAFLPCYVVVVGR